MSGRLPGRRLVIGFGLLALAPTDARAQALPFFTDTAQTVGFSSNAARTFSRFVVRNDLRSGGNRVPDAADNETFFFAQVVAVPIRLDGDTVLTAVTRVVHQELSSTDPGGGRATRSAGGLGDTTLLLKRRFYANNFAGGGFQLAVQGGVKLPTGNSDAQDGSGRLPRGLQPGSGSVDVPVGLILTAFKDRVGFNAAVSHQFNTASDDFSFGDQTRLDLALGYRLTPARYTSFYDKVVNLYLEVNGSVSGRASSAAQSVEDSGGTVVFLTPGIQFVLHPRLLVEAAFQIPVVQDLNGVQLGFEPTANAGLRMLF